ncbi:unnamed protein product [Arctia plantaginis]|uniref:Kinase n=1 Tax=Arctia plantaginis TaxID=874455 RepID=A0A8S1B0T4_ARCPL|nr:unnamed protein product [Arctia plantaginis]
MMPKPIAFPTDALEIQAYAMQVAGHKKTEDTKFLGLLQCSNGTILKPIIKEAQKREVDFYKRISLSEDPDLVELRSCTAKYFGCKKFTYNGFEQEYIILEDLTVRMLEPCVMDVKIGKRTWDPLATEEKIKKEKSKYTECKQQYGFCIPGFHVYKHTTGQLHKYNKDYGKRLHGEAVKDAIRKYLNGLGTVLCRALVLQFLSQLWRIQKWARHQLALRLYSTSLLLVYDATRLRECCGETKDPPSRSSPVCWGGAGVGAGAGAARRASLGASNFSGQVGAHGPLYSRVSGVPTLPLASHAALGSPDPPPALPSPWDDALQRLSVTHSPDHNYDGKLSRIKMNYRATLDQLCSDSPNPNPWGTVKIIDFVHAFFNDEDEREPDDNFREGIDNFVEIFESFLRETDDQVIYA